MAHHSFLAPNPSGCAVGSGPRSTFSLGVPMDGALHRRLPSAAVPESGKALAHALIHGSRPSATQSEFRRPTTENGVVQGSPRGLEIDDSTSRSV